ncbi:ABC transporter permease [uncultured Tolumonas sp.]|uniref:ABC transporter permease n=1 Tax=uncultured Tolumonas sp. TaxID=263765 RepID=UPI002930E21D|nr:ABC transporter permease [uncultured Tolumonas sp.]
MSEHPFTSRSSPLARRLRHQAALGLEIVASGLSELWAHKLRSFLTLTLLMLGVFAQVVLTSVLDGVVDKVRTGFAGMSWDGTLVLAAKAPQTTLEKNRFAISPGLRIEDLPRLTVPDPRIMAFLPRATRESAIRVAHGSETAYVSGVTPNYAATMNRRIASGRGLTDEDQRQRRPVAVLGSTFASKLLGGVDPVGRKVMVEGVAFQVVGVLAPLTIFNDDAYADANGILVPLEAYMDRLEPTHRLDQLGVKLFSSRDLKAVSALMVDRARQAHHGVEDTRILDLNAEATRSYRNFMAEMRNWRIVLACLSGTVLLVGGVGVLSVMLISFSDRRYEVGLRKAVGATDQEIFIQFLLEALILAALGALGGTGLGAAVCRAIADKFPYGVVVNPFGLAVAWLVALALAIAFGLYPALRAMRLSPIEAMR